MDKCKIPVCYFPTTVLLVDDNTDFLTHFSFQLPSASHYVLSGSPKKALEFFQHHQRPVTLDNNWVERVAKEKYNVHSIQLNLLAIHQEIFDNRRFQEISVIVADYSMPSMNGVEFFSQLPRTGVKRILLTGQGHENIIVNAFNEGKIDRYIHKGDPNLKAVIEKTIADLQWQYFKEFSENISQILSLQGFDYLHDSQFESLLRNIILKHQAVEFYLMENSGSYLLLNKKGEPDCLLVKSEKDLERLTAQAQKHHAPERVIQQLLNREAIPYFWQVSEFDENVWDDWQSQLRPAQKIECAKTYYYAEVKNPAVFDLPANKIVAWEHFLKSSSFLENPFI